MDQFDRLKKAFITNNLVICVGAGCSAATVSSVTDFPYVLWKGLLEEGVNFCKSRRLIQGNGSVSADALIENLESDLRVGQYVSAASKLVDFLGGNQTLHYRDWLAHTVGKLTPQKPDLLSKLLRLNVPILTTNYDTLIEQVATKNGLVYASYDQHTEASVLQECIRGEKPGVIHVHGWWERPETIVLNFESYYDVLKNDLIQRLLNGLLVTKTILFVGYGGGLADPNFGPLIEAHRKTFPLPHYQLVLDGDVPTYPDSTGVVSIGYGATHAELDAFFDRLLGKTPEARKEAFITGLYNWRRGLDMVFLNKRWSKSDGQVRQFHQLSSDLQAVTHELVTTIPATHDLRDQIHEITNNMEDLIGEVIHEAERNSSATRQERRGWQHILDFARISLLSRLDELV